MTNKISNISERSYADNDQEWLWQLYEESLKQYIQEQWGWDEAVQKEGFWGKLPKVGWSARGNSWPSRLTTEG